jgi:hypothetical protein
MCWLSLNGTVPRDHFVTVSLFAGSRLLLCAPAHLGFGFAHVFIKEAEIEEKFATHRFLAGLIVLNAMRLRVVRDVLIEQLFASSVGPFLP